MQSFARAAAIAITALALLAPSASATFKGANGPIVFTTVRDGTFDVYSMNPDGSGQAPLATGPSEELWPAVAPDGRTTAFVSTRSEAHGEIHLLLDVPGAIPKRLTSNTLAEEDPVFSPDGRRIAFTQETNSGRQLFTMRTDGTDAQQITDWPAEAHDPDWSPDGKRIAFWGSDGQLPQIYTVDAASGNNVTELTNEDVDDEGISPSYSPDGKRIAFATSAYGPTYDIYTMSSVDGGDRTPVATDASNATEPAFSPDGTRVAYTTSFQGDREIWTRDVDGANLEALTSNQADDFGPAWTPIPVSAGAAAPPGQSGAAALSLEVVAKRKPQKAKRLKVTVTATKAANVTLRAKGKLRGKTIKSKRRSTALAAAQPTKLKLKLSKRTLKRIAGRKAKLRLSATATAGAETATATAKLRVRGKKRRG